MKFFNLLLLLFFSQLTFSEPMRIVSADSSATEILLALGQGDKLVGVDATSHVPKAYQGLPNIGYHRQLSAEGLMSLKPNLVIGSDVMGPPVVIKALRAAKVDTLQLQQAKTIDDLMTNIQRIQSRVNCDSCAEPLLSQLQQKMKAIKQQKITDKKYVFLMTMDGKKLRIAGKGTAADSLVKLLNGNNMAEHDGYRNLSLEGLLAINPDIILLTSRQVSERSLSEFKQAFPLLNKKTVIQVDGKSIISGVSMAMLDEVIRINHSVRD